MADRIATGLLLAFFGNGTSAVARVAATRRLTSSSFATCSVTVVISYFPFFNENPNS